MTRVMDKAKIFYKIASGKEVYLIDMQEDCVLKLFADGERVAGMLKRHGKEPYQVDIRDSDIFDIMCESDETTHEVYEQY